MGANFGPPSLFLCFLCSFRSPLRFEPLKRSQLRELGAWPLGLRLLRSARGRAPIPSKEHAHSIHNENKTQRNDTQIIRNCTVVHTSTSPPIRFPSASRTRFLLPFFLLPFSFLVMSHTRKAEMLKAWREDIATSMAEFKEGAQVIVRKHQSK